jgi:hypothetical protein
VADAFLRAKQVLREREVVLRALASRLVEVETMDAAEMDRIIIAAEAGTLAATNGAEPPAEAAAGA